MSTRIAKATASKAAALAESTKAAAETTKTAAEHAKPTAEVAKPAVKTVKPEAHKAKVETTPKVEATPASTDDAEAADKPKRVQTTSLLGTSVSNARCATHVKRALGGSPGKTGLPDLRKALAAAKAANNAVDAESFQQQIDEIVHSSIRVSADHSIAMSVVADGILNELIRFGMDQSIACKTSKMVGVAHLHNGAVADLTFYPLFANCVAWKKYDPVFEEELKAKRAAANKAIREARDAKKAAGTGVVELSPAVVTDDDEDSSDATGKTTFMTYVDDAVKKVRTDEQYAAHRVHCRVREYLSDLIAQVIAHLTTLGKIVVQNAAEVRTMNPEHLKVVIMLLMMNDGKNKDTIDKILSTIDEKLSIYQAHLDGERAKKAAAVEHTATDQAAALELRKKKRLEALTIRAKKDAEEIRTLTV